MAAYYIVYTIFLMFIQLTISKRCNVCIFRNLKIVAVLPSEMVLTLIDNTINT